MSEIATVDDETIDWAKAARQSLETGETKGMRKLTRRKLTDLCTSLAEGIPYQTAARIHGLRPETVDEWQRIRPTAGMLIDKARGKGELLRIRNIAKASDWKAQDRLLQMQQPEYAQDSGAASSGGGPAIQVVINVPLPQLVEPGDKPIIDISPVVSPTLADKT